MRPKFYRLLILILVLSIALPTAAFAQNKEPLVAGDVVFTILHTNDFHGQLESSGSNPGYARTATIIKAERTLAGAENVLLLDAGDAMQGSLLSNLYKGESTIDLFKFMGVQAATFGNHEFDWGKDVLLDRITQAGYPFVSANIVEKGAAATCDTAGWTSPFTQPYVVKTMGTAPNQVNVGIIGVTTQETPYITIAEATAGLCFKDPTDAISHYYEELDAATDVIVVLSHLGNADGGYGYGFTSYGDGTLAKKLITAGKPVNLIIGGHSHTDLSAAQVITVTGKPGSTIVAQAHYNGRKVGKAVITVNKSTGTVGIVWTRLVVVPSNVTSPGVPTPEDPDTLARIAVWSSNPDYQTKVNEPVGYTNVSLVRNYYGDSLMAEFIDDAVYNFYNKDADLTNNVDMVFQNAGGIRADITSAAYPYLMKYGDMFNVLPFGNTTIVGTMTGAQILDLLNQSASLYKGALQPSGIKYKFYFYGSFPAGKDAVANQWGAYDIEVKDPVSGVWAPLDLAKVYKVATNEFLAPAGQDGYLPFKYMTNISYSFTDMLDQVIDWVKKTNTISNPYNGPDGTGVIDNRIWRNGNDVYTPDTGEIIPVTVLHHNDSHGNLVKTSYVGYTQLVTLIRAERLKNPDRTLLLSSGDNIQGDAMMYYFKSAALGYAADGTALPVDLQMNPLIKAFNAMGYDAFTLGNHEFNFGKEIFTSSLTQANFPVLQANLTDSGAYGLADVPVEPFVMKSVGPEGIDIAILGIGNHRVPNYELPSNIPGLTFTNPIDKAAELVAEVDSSSDAIVALTHIGFTTNPSSVEVDKNVDTYLAAQVGGIDAIVGGHSHTDPSQKTSASGDYRYLPAVLVGPGTVPVLINQAYRYNSYLGVVILGFLPDGAGGFDVITRVGKNIKVATVEVEDPAIKALIDPYTAMINTYNNVVLGTTTAPIDALAAFTQETNGANMQADASVHELESHGIEVDFHLSGAMTNKKVADAATPASPVTLKVSDMFSLMPYENSLVVLSMNGPQLKAVLERGYRNYYYYKYVPDKGGYSYYTTCMLDINKLGKITYNDRYPEAYDAAKQYVVSLEFDGKTVDFSDAATYYRVSTVNYLAAGSCNFNNSGVSLWPLNQIENDTQYYVRDAVINYIKAMGQVSPAIEGRLAFLNDFAAPEITITSPMAKDYWHHELVTLDFTVTDAISGVRSVMADLDGEEVVDGQVIDLYTLTLGQHTLTVQAVDMAWNQSSASVTFNIKTSIDSMLLGLRRLYETGAIDNFGIYNSLNSKLMVANRAMLRGEDHRAANILVAFIHEVEAQKGKHIAESAANVLIEDAMWLLQNVLGMSGSPFGNLGGGHPVYLPLIRH